MGRLLALAAACHQITFIVVESWLFKGLRDAAAARNEHLGKLVSCHLCFGTWVGMALAALFRPTLVRPSGYVPGPARALLQWAVDAFVISLVARVMNETIASVREDVEVKKKEAELLETEVRAEEPLAEQEPQRAG
ncbi:MAG TPA: hypothetical protein VFW12_05035 [Candidatus Limnocylindria bacterium]|nr:hypothetical protein [Candidatus Limnocylindria bacterium]